MTDYWSDFVRESRDRITELNNALLTLERNPDDSEAMEEVFRIAHTLKGNCGAAGLEGASELAHAIEDLLDAVRASRLEVSPELMDDIFDAVDDLETMVERVADHEESGNIDVAALQTAPSGSIQSLRAHLEGPAPIEVPTDEEIEDVLSRFEQPAGDRNVYLVRISVAESEAEEENAGILVVKALIDAFDLIGTAPPRHAIEAHAYNGRFDAVFASAVTKAAIASGLEPVDEVADFELVNVTEQFEAVAAATDEGDAAGGLSDPDISADEAQDLEVDELLGEFNQYDDLDNLVEEVEDDDDLDAFDEMGKAGSFDDLLGDDDVEIEFDETDDVDAETAEASPAEANDGATDDTGSTAASDDSDASASVDDTGDADDVDDAEAVFQELKDEVEMVGFDELQDELDELEFDEFDTDEEVGMDELLGDDFADDSDEASLGEAESMASAAESVDTEDDALEADLEDLVTGEESSDDDDDETVDEDDGDTDETVTPVPGFETAPDADAEAEAEAESEDEAVDADLETDRVEDAPVASETGDDAEADSLEESIDEPADVETETDTADDESALEADDDSLTAETDSADLDDETAVDNTASSASSDEDDELAGAAESESVTADNGGEDSESVTEDDADESEPDAEDDVVEVADDSLEPVDSETDADSLEADSDLDATVEDSEDDEVTEDDADTTDVEFSAGGFEPATDSLEPADSSTTDDTTATDADDESTGDIVDFSTFGSEIGAAVDESARLEDSDADDAANASADNEWTTPDTAETDSFAPVGSDDAPAFDDEDVDDVSFEPTVDTDDSAAFDQQLEDEDSVPLEADFSVDTDDSDTDFETTDDEAPAFDPVTDTADSNDFDIDDDASFDALEASTNVEADFDSDESVAFDDSASEETSFTDDAGSEDPSDDTLDDSLDSLEQTLESDGTESFEDTFGDDAFTDLESDEFDSIDSALETDDTDGFGDSAAETSDEQSRTAPDSDEPEIVIDEPSLEVPDIEIPDESRTRDTEDDASDSQSVRVDVEQIDDLLTLVEGLVTSRVRLRDAVEADEDRQTLETELDALEDLTGDLQETVMDVRLVPLGTVTNRLPRVVRDISREQDKTVEFNISGEDVELDRTVLDRISDPLMHLVRNAVDHGIEAPDERADTDKPEEGTVEVTATRTRDRVKITVEDDGSGLDPDRLRSEALEAGVIGEEDAAALSDEQVYELVFHPGLSTADEVTDVSGRGVGMDVVKRTVTELDGSVSIDSSPGDGTTVNMLLPVSIAIDEVLFLESNGQEFGIPIDVVHDIESASSIETVDGDAVLPVGNADGFGTESTTGSISSESAPTDHEPTTEYSATVPVVSLDDVLETTAEQSAGTDGSVLVRIRDDVREVAFQCDQVHGQQEVVVKPFEGFMTGIPGLSGATVRGRGAVVNILDVTTL